MVGYDELDDQLVWGGSGTKLDELGVGIGLTVELGLWFEE